MLPGLVRAPLAVHVALPGGGKAALEGLVIRPDRPGRFPVVVMVHGTPRGTGAEFAAAIARTSPASFNTAAVAFAQRGYAAVAILRRGFGKSDGPYAEGGAGPCNNRDYLRVARISAEDVTGAAAALRQEPWADPDRVVLLGLSTGGFAVTAAGAANPPGVLGVIAFAGGRGSAAPDQVCDAERLVQAAGAFGRSARAPALWIYAENDHFFGPALARRMFDAYVAGGAPARLEMLPPFRADGHTLLAAGHATLWWPAVEPFLASLLLPTKVVVDLPPLPDLPAPPFVRGATCRAGFADYVTARTEAKAFAVNPDGACGWAYTARTADEAKQTALRNCNRNGAGCALYAVGHALDH
nr:alpha/beta hydrolase [Limobrevibacterium gyesilva]